MQHPRRDEDDGQAISLAASHPLLTDSLAVPRNTTNQHMWRRQGTPVAPTTRAAVCTYSTVREESSVRLSSASKLHECLLSDPLL